MTSPGTTPASVPHFDIEAASGRKLAVICSNGSLDRAYSRLILAKAALPVGAAMALVALAANTGSREGRSSHRPLTTRPARTLATRARSGSSAGGVNGPMRSGHNCRPTRVRSSPAKVPGPTRGRVLRES